MLRYLIFTCSLMLRYLDATLLDLHLQLDATLLDLHLQLDAMLLNFHLQLDATLQGLRWLTVAGKISKPSWVLTCAESTRSEDVVVCIHMLCRMSTCGFGDKASDLWNPRHVCSNWRSYCDPQKWKKKKRPDQVAASNLQALKIDIWLRRNMICLHFCL